MKTIKKILNFILIVVILWAAFYSTVYHNDFVVLKSDKINIAQNDSNPNTVQNIIEDGIYTTKDDVALYIHTFGHLPSNFVTKEFASASGWKGGSLEEYVPGFCIGGNKFGNFEDILPTSYKRVYRECDIDTLGMESRGAKRIVFSNDGFIYYTENHYESFELLYGSE
jgi:hypothetical protein